MHCLFEVEILLFDILLFFPLSSFSFTLHFSNFSTLSRDKLSMTRGESTRKRTSVSYSEQGEGEEDQDEVSSTRSGRKTIKRKPQVEQDYSDEEEDKYIEGESIHPTWLVTCCC